MNVIHMGVYTILSLVDEEALGRVEKDEERGIVISLPERFYRGKLVGEPDAIKAMTSYDYIILAGCRAVQLGIEMGIVDPRSVLEVNGLKYVQVMKSYF
jgi:hypothetical protein